MVSSFIFLSAASSSAHKSGEDDGKDNIEEETANDWTNTNWSGHSINLRQFLDKNITVRLTLDMNKTMKTLTRMSRKHLLSLRIFYTLRL